MVKKKAIVCMLLCTAMTLACACGNSKDKTESKDNDSKTATDTVDKEKKDTTTKDNEEVKDTTTDIKVGEDTTTNDSKDTVGDTSTITNPIETTTTPVVETPADTTEPPATTEAPPESVALDSDMSNKVREYILNGQGNALGATSMKWSAQFLNAVDIDSLYKEFVAEGGAIDDVVGVAGYITSNAPVASNWQEMFEEEFNSSYGQYPTRIEYLEGVSYQVYANIEGNEVPYVVVNSRTGYWHG